MNSYRQFEDQIFDAMRDLEIRQRSAVFESFVHDMAKIGITIDQLIEMTKGCTTGTEFIERAKAAAIAKGEIIAA